MLALRARILYNAFRQSPLAAAIGLLLGLGMAYLAWSGTTWFLEFITREIVGGSPLLERLSAVFTRNVLVERLLGVLLLVLSSSVVLSALPNAIAVLYSSEDLPILLTLPQRAAKVFLFKVAETFATTALIPAVFTLPVVFAVGAFYEAPWFFYPAALLVVLALYAFPVAIGVGLALPLVRLAPAGRAKEWAAAVGAVLGGGLIFLLRALRPEALIQTNFADPDALDRFLQGFRDPTTPFLPSSLASDALEGLMKGRFTPEFFGLIGLSLLLLALAGLLAGYAYQIGWVRALEGTVQERGLRRPGFWDRLGARGQAVALWVRDLRLFLRDANQAAQLVLVGVLVLMYTTSLQFIPLEGERFRVVVGFLHLAFQGFVIAGVGVRLAYPLYSLEGPGFWLIQTAPVSRLTLLLTRFGLALIFLLPLALLLGLLSPQVIGLGANLTQISLLIAVASAFASAGLGVGLGAAFPRFDASNPAEVPLGLGGLLYMGLSLLHSAFLVVLAARPVYLSFSGRGTYLAGPEGPLWLLLLLAVTLLPAWAALALGYRRMGNPA
jgi:ABC-2 type transport system permease protein